MRLFSHMFLKNVLRLACYFLLPCIAKSEGMESQCVLRNDLNALIQQIQDGKNIRHAELHSLNRRVALVTNKTSRASLLNEFESKLFMLDPQDKEFRDQEVFMDNVWDVARGVWGSPPGGTLKEWWTVYLKALAWEKKQLDRIEKSKPADNRTWTEKWQNPEPLADEKYREWRRLVQGTKSKFYSNHLRRSAYEAEDDRYTPEFRAWCWNEIEKIIGRPLTDDDIMFKDDVLQRREERKKRAHDEKVRTPYDGGDVLPHPFTFLGCTFGNAYDLSNPGGKYAIGDEILYWNKNFKIEPYFGKVWMMLRLAPRSKIACSAEISWSGHGTREELSAQAMEIKADLEKRLGVTLGDFFFETLWHVCDEETWKKAESACMKSRSVFGPIMIETNAFDYPQSCSPPRRLELKVTDTGVEALVEKERKENPMKYDREAELRRHQELIRRIEKRNQQRQKQQNPATAPNAQPAAPSP